MDIMSVHCEEIGSEPYRMVSWGWILVSPAFRGYNAHDNRKWGLRLIFSDTIALLLSVQLALPGHFLLDASLDLQMNSLWMPIRIGMWAFELDLVGLDLAQLLEEARVCACEMLATPECQSDLLKSRLSCQDLQALNQMLVVHVASLLVAFALWRRTWHGIVEADPHVTDVGGVDWADQMEEESQVLVSNLLSLASPEWPPHILVALEAECVLAVQDSAAFFIYLTARAEESGGAFEVVGLAKIKLSVILEEKAVDFVAQFWRMSAWHRFG